MSQITIHIRSHHFKLTNFTPRVEELIKTFAKKFVRWQFVKKGPHKFRREPTAIYAASTRMRTEYRFHINTLNDFMELLTCNFLHKNAIIINEPCYAPADATHILKPGWAPRDEQIKPIEYLLDPVIPSRKFVPVQTGRGKSFITMYTMSKLCVRTLIVIRPMYIEKWIQDIGRTFEIAEGDIVVVQGLGALQQLMLEAEQDTFNPKIIIISNKTMQLYLKQYESLGNELIDFGFSCLPENLCQLLKVGIRVIDEVHQDFHLNVKLDMYTHIARSISLSATLTSQDMFMMEMYGMAYPINSRYIPPKYIRYVSVKACVYRFNFPNKIRTKEYGSNSYSHNAFETSLMRYGFMLDNYSKMVGNLLKTSYFVDRKQTEKAIVFCYSIALATHLTQYLQSRYPDVNVQRYVEEDSFENLGNADIIVSTLLSAGTALDIDNLTTVIMTTCVSSEASNLQALGRLRELKSGRVPVFLFLQSSDLSKQMEYMDRKKVLFTGKALTYETINIPDPI